MAPMTDPKIDPNTKFEGWLHYPDNVKRQIVVSLKDWMKERNKEPFKFEPIEQEETDAALGLSMHRVHDRGPLFVK